VSSSFNGTASSELYDPVRGTFVPGGAMSIVRAGHAAALLPNGKVLVVGGSGDRSAELYNPVSRLFELTGGTERAFGISTLTVLPDGTVLLFGNTQLLQEHGMPIVFLTEIYHP
jgi:hypothetical protein